MPVLRDGHFRNSSQFQCANDHIIYGHQNCANSIKDETTYATHFYNDKQEKENKRKQQQAVIKHTKFLDTEIGREEEMNKSAYQLYTAQSQESDKRWLHTGGKAYQYKHEQGYLNKKIYFFE
jgi:hypothetical protein